MANHNRCWRRYKVYQDYTIIFMMTPFFTSDVSLFFHDLVILSNGADVGCIPPTLQRHFTLLPQPFLRQTSIVILPISLEKAP